MSGFHAGGGDEYIAVLRQGLREQLVILEARLADSTSECERHEIRSLIQDAEKTFDQKVRESEWALF